MLGWSGPLTHRQLLVWQAWFRADMDEPSRADWYVMQLTAATLKDKDGPSKYKLKFNWQRRRDEDGTVSEEEAATWAMARWGGILGIRPDGTPSKRRRRKGGEPPDGGYAQRRGD